MHLCETRRTMKTTIFRTFLLRYQLTVRKYVVCTFVRKYFRKYESTFVRKYISTVLYCTVRVVYRLYTSGPRGILYTYSTRILYTTRTVHVELKKISKLYQCVLYTYTYCSPTRNKLYSTRTCTRTCTRTVENTKVLSYLPSKVSSKIQYT